jgi:23S rRNA (cytosine1962-C5)-methyltransferase
MSKRSDPLDVVAVPTARDVDVTDRGQLILKKRKDGPARHRHPWIFSGAIDDVRGSPGAGDVVVVTDADGVVLGRGHYSPPSQIRARLLTFGDVAVTHDLVRERLRSAWALRDELVFSARPGDETDSARLVFGEGDLLPGLIIDVYGDTAVLQAQSAGAERVLPIVLDALRASGRITRAVLRSDADVRKKEGLPLTKGLAFGDAPAAPIVAREHGARFLVDVVGGHKTGFYLDQRDSRQTVRAAARVARSRAEAPKGRRVLNCFCYTGGFSVMALLGGAAHVTSVDTSLPALELGEQNASLNGFGDDRHEWLKGDCFDVLAGLHDDGERYDLVVLDPPKFAPSGAHLEKAARGYRDLMTRGLRVTRPGGLVFTFSCSGAVTREHFRLLLAQAALNAGREVQLLGELGHSRCHPMLTSFPEGEYLKGLWARVT